MKKVAVCGAEDPRVLTTPPGLSRNSVIWFRKDPTSSDPRKVVMTYSNTGSLDGDFDDQINMNHTKLEVSLAKGYSRKKFKHIHPVAVILIRSSELSMRSIFVIVDMLCRLI